MILGERFFKLSNALFCFHLTPIQFTVYSFLVSSAGRKEKCWPSMKTIASTALKRRRGRLSPRWNRKGSSGG